MKPTTRFAIAAAMLATTLSISLSAAPAQIIASALDGGQLELRAITQRELEPILDNIQTSILGGLIPVVRPSVQFIITGDGITAEHFTSTSLHDCFRFGTASVITAQMEHGLVVHAEPVNSPPNSWRVTLQTPPGDIGELIIIARDGGTNDQDVGYLMAVSENGTVQGATALRQLQQQRMPDMVQRVRSDMRSMATALEAYRIDSNTYPPAAAPGSPKSFNVNDPLMSQMTAPVPAPLTTPIAYITHYVQDPFAPSGTATFGYATLRQGDPLYGFFGDWVLLSPGPDGDWDLNLTMSDSRQIESLIYDPNNGPQGNGDIVRGQRYP